MHFVVQLMVERKSYTEESSSFQALPLTCADHITCASDPYTTIRFSVLGLNSRGHPLECLQSAKHSGLTFWNRPIQLLLGQNSNMPLAVWYSAMSALGLLD